jgi:hypothetical protein
LHCFSQKTESPGLMQPSFLSFLSSLGHRHTPEFQVTAYDNSVIAPELTKTTRLFITAVSIGPLQNQENMGLF